MKLEEQVDLYLGVHDVECVCSQCGVIYNRQLETAYTSSPNIWRRAGYPVISCFDCQPNQTSLELTTSRPSSGLDLEALASAQTQEEFERILDGRSVPEALGRYVVARRKNLELAYEMEDFYNRLELEPGKQHTYLIKPKGKSNG